MSHNYDLAKLYQEQLIEDAKPDPVAEYAASERRQRLVGLMTGIQKVITRKILSTKYIAKLGNVDSRPI
jgi:hypothetical protein